MPKFNINKYSFRVDWSQEDGVHVSTCLEFPSLSAHGKTPEAALKEIRNALRESIKWMEEKGEEVPVPFSERKYKGNLTLRVAPEVHRKLAIEASSSGVSINQYILSKIA